MQALSHSSVLGVIEGGDNLEERLRSAKETAIRPVDGMLVRACCQCCLNVFQFYIGFVVEGFEVSHEDHSLPSVLSTVTKVLPEEKPRFIVGLTSCGMLCHHAGF